MIDDAGLGLQPFSPARLTNFGGDFLAEFGRQRQEAEGRALTSRGLDKIWSAVASAARHRFGLFWSCRLRGKPKGRRRYDHHSAAAAPGTPVRSAGALQISPALCELRQ